MAIQDEADVLMQPPSDQVYDELVRRNAPYYALRTFELDKGEAKHYQQQFGDMYFLRLAKLKPAVEAVAVDAWQDYELAGEIASRVDRVLDVRQGQLCWIAGTVYMDMPLKPNILEDIAKDQWISAPPPREKYLSPDGEDKVMLEDESGRLRLTGALLQTEMLATGCIIAVLGTENSDGDFEVLGIKVPDLPGQPKRWQLDPRAADGSNGTTAPSSASKVAILSGLAITGEQGDSLYLDLLLEWLLGESASLSDQSAAARISRLIIAGNSLSEAAPAVGKDDAQAPDRTKKPAASKKYGYDASTYNPTPTIELDVFLSTLLPSLPITLIPGASDPANISLPQQPLHPALFPHSRAYAAPPALQDAAPTSAKAQAPVETGSFHPATNPCAFTLSGNLFVATGGQPVNDIAKYIDPAPPLEVMEQTLRWRLLAPTAPDTLWCYPYQSDDPFVLRDGQCPHVYICGDQPMFGTTLIEGPAGQKVRCISVPRFRDTGEIALLDLETLEVEIVRFDVMNDATNNGHA